MSHHQFVTRYWILAISTTYGCGRMRGRMSLLKSDRCRKETL